MGSSSTFPSGLVTLMFTGIEDAAQFWEKYPKDFYPTLERHNLILHGAIARADGSVVKVEGDIFMAVFSSAPAAIAAALDAQCELAAAEWIAPIGPVSVAIGLHTGEPIVGTHPDGATDYFGPPVNRAARVAAAAHGGQIVVSDATRAAAAAAASSDVTFVDLGSHFLKGVEGAEKLFQISHPNLPSREFPAPRTLSAVRHNIPKPLTSFIGRRKQLDELSVRIIQSPERLLTLGGATGIGKTRLAQQLAMELANEFTDGAWYVDLAGMDPADRVIEAVASVFAIRPQPPRTLLEQLAMHISHKEMLLILDHAKRLPDDLLAAIRASDIEYVITSEDPAPAAGDVYIVPPLELPAADDLDAVKRSDAAMLFEERAKHAAPTFEIAPDNAAPVAQMLRKIGGAPNLIELAAARMRSMSPQQLLERLEKGMNLLSSRAGGTLELKLKPKA